MEPMLAKAVDFNLLRFPVWGSAKLDGIRCMPRGGVAMSRTFKPLPNDHVQMCLADLPDGLDGELVVGPPNAYDVMRKTTSGVMSKNGFPDFTYLVFDWIDETLRYDTRQMILEDKLKTVFNPYVKFHPSRLLMDMKELLDFEAICLEEGYEGIILRAAHMPYKFGRSTTREQGMLKLKRFEDSEGEIVGIEQFMHNANEATEDAFGRTKRSSHAENKIPVEKMGKLVVKDKDSKVEVVIGTGFDDAFRTDVWLNKEKYLGKLAKYKYFAHGMKDGVPRHSVFLGMRSEIDV